MTSTAAQREFVLRVDMLGRLRRHVFAKLGLVVAIEVVVEKLKVSA
jgi:hypothetical protein